MTAACSLGFLILYRARARQPLRYPVIPSAACFRTPGAREPDPIAKMESVKSAAAAAMVGHLRALLAWCLKAKKSSRARGGDRAGERVSSLLRQTGCSRT